VLVCDAHVAGQPGHPAAAAAYFDGYATQPTVRVENR
jgi:hypothetical protein